MPRERWLPVVGFENWYHVSDRGRLKRVGRCRGARAGRVLKLRLNNNRLWYTLSAGPEHRKRLIRVSWIVLEAFVGPRPKGHWACHYDDDPTNNRLSNLRWDLPGGNIRDMYRNNPWVRKRRSVRMKRMWRLKPGSMGRRHVYAA